MTDIVDAWGQITTERMARQPWLQPLLRWLGRPGELLAPSVRSTLAAMDAAGVASMLISAWHGPEGELISNGEVAEQVAEAKELGAGRLYGVASVDLRQPMQAVRAIRQCVERQGFVGVRVLPWLWELPPNHRRYYPVYAACVEAGVPFCTQIGHTGPLRSSEVGRLIPYLEDVLLDFPELVVVGGHVGFPWLDELTTLCIKFENFHVDTSAYVLQRLPAAFVDWMKGPGRKRAMFGTNWPMLEPARCLQGLAQLGLDATTQAAFLAGNARRVYKLPPA